MSQTAGQLVFKLKLVEPEMNSLIESVYPLFKLYQSLRTQLVDTLSEADLQFALPNNPALGELCVEIGEIQVAYLHSFQTFMLDFSYRNEDPGLARNLAALKAWYARLDAELEAVLMALSEQDLQERQIDRGENFKVSPRVQLEIYKEALLIFYGKASVYLKALGHMMSPHWQHWIG